MDQKQLNAFILCQITPSFCLWVCILFVFSSLFFHSYSHLCFSTLPLSLSFIAKCSRGKLFSDTHVLAALCMLHIALHRRHTVVSLHTQETHSQQGHGASAYMSDHTWVCLRKWTDGHRPRQKRAVYQLNLHSVK